MRHFNELKILLLDYFRDSDPVTSRTIAIELDLTLEGTQMALYRMFKQRLLNRDPLPKVGPGRKKYVYTISDRGLGRLEFLTKKP